MNYAPILDWRRRVFALYAGVRSCPDPVDGHALWCDGRAELLRTHPASPVPESERAGYQGPRHAPYDPSLRFCVPVATGVEAQRLNVTTGTDGVVPFERLGRVDLEGVGSLDVWWLASYGGGLFLPLRDASAGGATYGGGRYVLDTVKGADLGGGAGPGERLTVDLNFAYNPSCAYDPAWACPLAPRGNSLPVPVYAGELTPV